MTPMNNVDPNSAVVEVKQAITDLMNFEDKDKEDDVMYAANKLKSVLRTLHDNYQAWNPETIRDFVISKNDPLRYIDIQSDEFNHRVRTIQEDMIVKFSLH